MNINVDWQEIVVALLVTLCAIRVGYGVYTFVRRAKKNENPCAGCPGGCSIKPQPENEQQECKEKKQAEKKNCDG